MSGIIWLASYPKSGNTWLRIFLANLLRDDEGPLHINDLSLPVAANRQIFDDAAGVEASDLTEEEIARYRPRVFRCLAATSMSTVFLKTHDAYTILPGGEPLIPTDVSIGAIYIVRNPLDVAISFAHHSGATLDRVITVMAEDHAFTYDPPTRNLSQRLLSWNGHVLSWVDDTPFPVHVVRYEDMLDQPLETFRGIASFCRLPCDSARVARAVRHSSFDRLRGQERASGFIERPQSASMFFREGKANVWRDVLSPSQVDRILGDHGAVMRRFGYP